MKILICALGILATVAWTQELDWTTLRPSVISPSGFDWSTVEPDQDPRMPDGSRCTTFEECLECCLVPDVIEHHRAHGFGSFYFGASREFVRNAQQVEGRTFHHETPGWIWYEGEIDGCHLDIGFEFTSDRLNSGLWQITNNDVCFNVVQMRLIDVYGRKLSMEINGSTIRSEMEVPFTKIVHEKNSRWHSVSFYDTTPVGG